MPIYIFGIKSLERILLTLLFSIPPRKRGIEKIRNISNDEKIRNNINDEKKKEISVMTKKKYSLYFCHNNYNVFFYC